MQIIKTFKTHVGKIAREEYGHHVLLALLDAVDDTVLVRKNIINVWDPSLNTPFPCGRAVL